VTPLLDLRIPVVALDRRLRRIAADTVLVDNERAAEEATEHLLDMGYGRAATAARRSSPASWSTAAAGESVTVPPRLTRFTQVERRSWTNSRTSTALA
jgi:DNA-binding LacI/PurR family transcriptional regulator